MWKGVQLKIKAGIGTNPIQTGRVWPQVWERGATGLRGGLGQSRPIKASYTLNFKHDDAGDGRTFPSDAVLSGDANVSAKQWYALGILLAASLHSEGSSSVSLDHARRPDPFALWM